ncbi:MAG: hypothetical protein HQL48_07420 [Gammaproteobacteria bacterium]|nr:hypothetical protein [Gammaproteobacteria bacterium]
MSLGLLILCAGLSVVPQIAHAMKPDLWTALIRQSGKLAEDIPLRNLDDAAERIRKARMNKMDDLRPPHGIELMRQLEKGLDGADPNLLKRLDQLDEIDKSTALVLVRGSDQIAKSVPDIALRGRLIREGGTNLIVSSGLYGDDMVKSALRFQYALDAGSIAVPRGKRAVDLAEFSTALTHYGKGSIRFFHQYIKPNWKVWASSGLLTWWVIAPDHFQDTAGNLVQSGIETITELAGEVAGSILGGVIEGGGTALENFSSKVTEALKRQGVTGVIALILLLFGALLLFRRVRYFVMAPIRWLNREPRER